MFEIQVLTELEYWSVISGTVEKYATPQEVGRQPYLRPVWSRVRLTNEIRIAVFLF